MDVNSLWWTLCLQARRSPSHSNKFKGQIIKEYFAFNEILTALVPIWVVQIVDIWQLNFFEIDTAACPLWEVRLRVPIRLLYINCIPIKYINFIYELLPMVRVLYVVRSSYSPVSLQPSSAPHPKSYLEVNFCFIYVFSPIYPYIHTLSTVTRWYLSLC